MGPESGLQWWDQQFLALAGGHGLAAGDDASAQQQVPYRAVFFPALVRACGPQSLPKALSRDELRVVVKFCLSSAACQRGVVTKEDVRGALSNTVFVPPGFLVPWFHGELGRREAERVLSARERSDGAFLVRFSESHPTKFTLSYLKVHPASSRTPGRRELKNCLDQQSDSYSAFSSESFGKPEPPANAAAMLFSQSPPQDSWMRQPAYGTNQYESGEASSSDNYAGFSLDALAPPVIHRVDTTGKNASINESKSNQDGHTKKGESAAPSFATSDYGNFASFAQQQQREPQEHEGACQSAAEALSEKSWTAPSSHSDASVSDEYATFADLASTYAQESQQVAARSQFAFSLSRSPTSAAASPLPRSFSPAASTSSARSGFGSNTAYGSFSSVAVTKPTSATAEAVSSSKRPPPPVVNDAYGSFASLSNQLEEEKPAWNPASTLGPPPSPPAPVIRVSTNQMASQEQMPTSPLSASYPPPDAYGSFDLTTVAPSTAPSSTQTRHRISALDELNVGMEFYKQKRLDDALLRFMLAQEVARATGDQVVEARALGNLGTVYLDKQNPQQAVRCYQQCLDITRAIEDTKRERTILNNLVLALVASEDLERALACCQVQLETTTNAINRRKIISRMSLLRERMTRRVSP
ncbi:hypothetical protein BBJ28_00009845 [Nothophytophthora sp. Chile5]|nr:hypothetical protein BBJ28_00009845 [Nothophytophthora sp. Chile5]